MYTSAFWLLHGFESCSFLMIFSLILLYFILYFLPTLFTFKFHSHFFCYCYILTFSPSSPYLRVFFLDIWVVVRPILVCAALQRRTEAGRSRASCAANTAHAWMANGGTEWVREGEQVSPRKREREGGRVDTTAGEQERISSCFKGWLSWQPIAVASLYP